MKTAVIQLALSCIMFGHFTILCMKGLNKNELVLVNTCLGQQFQNY